MELIYFISGILTVGVVYGVVLFQKIKLSHTELLGTSQSLLNISSIRSAEFEEQLGDLKILIVDIQSSMEKDQYKSLSAVNKRIK